VLALAVPPRRLVVIVPWFGFTMFGRHMIQWLVELAFMTDLFVIFVVLAVLAVPRRLMIIPRLGPHVALIVIVISMP
jgi:hypothetical protein